MPATGSLEQLLDTLTLKEKVSLLTGRDFWSTRAIDRIGLRPVVFSDGPSGIRGEAWDERDPSISLPSASSLSASWDLDLARAYGEVLADEAQRKGVDVVLGPTINMHRTPSAGRHFESFSEDPLLTADLAYAYVAAIQAHGIGATPKHYVCNDFETDRYTVDVRVSTRALREVYLLAFERSVTEARAWLVMSSYNSINGVTASENELLQTPLNDEWGFDGVVIGDWTGVRSLEAARHPQDLAMPGPDGPWGDALVTAVEAGEIPLEAVDRKVLRLLRLAARCGALDGVEPPVPRSRSGRDALAFARSAAAAGAVLLENRDRLPIAPRTVRRLAVIGHAAVHPRIQGGGSATVVPSQIVTPLQGLRAAYPEATIDYVPGVLVEDGLIPLPLESLRNPVTGEPGTRVEFMAHDRVIHVEDRRSSDLVWFGGDAPITEATEVTISTVYTPQATGPVRLGVAVTGPVQFEVDGQLLIDTVIEPAGDDLGAALLAPPAEAVTVEGVAGEPITLQLRHVVGKDAAGLTNALGIQLGALSSSVDDDALIDRAVEAAREADLTVIVVSSNDALEAEGADRPTLSLPGRQDDMVAAVAAVDPGVVVVVNCGAPTLLPWAQQVGAVLQMWFPGQEFGHALGDLMTGRSEPGGRLPTTWPAREEDLPVPRVQPVDGVVTYDEEIHVGYRGWLRAGAVPAYPFGHGLGYTRWVLNSLEVPGAIEDAPSVGRFTVTTRVTNVGDRRGKQVVQLYASRAESGVDRPHAWLIGFGAVEADPQQTVELRIDVAARSFAHYDGEWRWEPGRFDVAAGFSLTDVRACSTIEVR
ncbi:beta-glucosidase [uncultured Aeromicrobium sp.]|uniref:beta-glucosidase family protein n=1 Tax=uncultured Aeromicrobium sp. TaxID=337820 RepID=UPI0025FC10BF|nr:glycoside hydrolase family 3 C-terminal domain-containing protein [uncultured Aeromicrobium sp.]